MRKLTSLLLVWALLAISLAACGGGDESEGMPASSSTPEAPKEKSSAGGFTWDDVPVYRGAQKVDKVEEQYIRKAGLGEFEEIEWRFYETTAPWEDVRDFYLDQMPGEGWQKLMAMSFPEGSAISTWYKDDGDTVCAVSLGLAQGGTAYLSIMRAHGPK